MRPLTASASFAAAISVFAGISVGLSAQSPAPGGLSLLEAARIALAEQPSINVSREQVTIAEGVLRTASGRFDAGLNTTVDRSRTPTPLRKQDVGTSPISTLLTNEMRLTLGLDKPLRSGLVVSPVISMTHQDVNLDPLATNRASVGLTLTQPLMRGKGAEVVTAEETAARLDVGASTDDLRHSAATGVLLTAVVYWNYVAAQRDLEIILASEARARRLVAETQILIDAGNRPAADIRQANANLAERVAQRSSYQESVFEARQSLGLAMGLSADRIAALPPPADSFPALAEPLPAPGNPGLLAAALGNRADLAALHARERSTRVLLVAARDGLRPLVNLNINMGYAGLAEGGSFPGLFGSLQQRMAGPDITASVTISRSPGNNTALGQLAQTDAALRQTTIRIDDLTRSIGSAVEVAEEALTRSAERVRLLHEAAGLYASAVTDERDKLQLGLSTIIDLISIEDRLTQSELDEVSAALSYATALARLRFETGTLVAGDATGFHVVTDAFTTVPLPGAARQNPGK